MSLYGLVLALGSISAYCIMRFFIGRFCSIRKELFSVDILFVVLVIFGIIGGRTLFVFYNLPYFFEYPWEIPAIWHGGWVWHGALIGGGLALFVYAKLKRISFFFLADFLVPGLALAQSIGRWGNYFNQELYGLPTNVPWAIFIDETNRVPGFESYARFHPTFLYESLWDFCLFILLFILVRSMYKRSNNRLTNMIGGSIFAWYLILYSVGRFFIEFLRIDPVPVIAGFRIPQLFSIAFVFLGAYILLWDLQRRKKMI